MHHYFEGSIWWCSHSDFVLLRMLSTHDICELRTWHKGLPKVNEYIPHSTPELNTASSKTWTSIFFQQFRGNLIYSCSVCSFQLKCLFRTSSTDTRRMQAAVHSQESDVPVHVYIYTLPINMLNRWFLVNIHTHSYVFIFFLNKPFSLPIPSSPQSSGLF